MDCKRTEDLLYAIKNGNEQERRFAIEDIGELGIDGAIPDLIQALYHPSHSIREAAVDALAKLDHKKVCEHIILVLDDPDVKARNCALEVFSQLGDVAIQTIMLRYPTAPSDLRKAFIDSLANNMKALQSKDAFRLVIRALEDKDINVACAAAETLCSFRKEECIEALLNQLGRHP